MFKLKSSLSRRIVAIVIGGFIAMLVLLVLLAHQLLWPDLQRVLLTQQQEGADRIVSRINVAIDERKKAMAHLAGMLHDGQALKNANTVQQILDGRILLHEYFNGGLNVITPDGRIWRDSPIHPGRRGVDLSDRDYIQRAFERKEPILVPPLIGRGLETPVFIILMPIINDSGEMLAVLLGITRLADENLLHRIAQESFTQQGRLYIIDTRLQKVVTATDLDLSMTPAARAPITNVLEAIESGQRSGVARGAKGARVLYASAPLEGMHWQVIRTLPYHQAFAPIFGILTPFILTSLGLIVLLVLLTLGLLRRQLRPLKETADTLDALAARKRPARVLPVLRHDEIGRLINSFNRIIQLRTVQKAKMLKAQERLKATLSSLQDQVDAAVEKTREQERLISDQSRRHALLNLLVNLAHQWRQPLNAAGLLVQEMEEDYQQGELTPQQMRRQVEQVMGQLRDLSETISHFTDLYQSSGTMHITTFEAILDRTLELVGKRLKSGNLTLRSDLAPGCLIRVCPADLVELLIELFENTLTIAKRRGLRGVAVNLTSRCEGELFILTLEDSAGGFDTRLLPSLFDPYAMEGYKAAGRGLGLFRIHELVTGHYRGWMRAENHETGARLVIAIPAVVRSKNKEGA